MAELQHEIAVLKAQRTADVQQIRHTFDATKKQFAPMTLLHDGLKDAFKDKRIQSSVLDGAVSVATGFLTKRAIVGASGGALRQLIGMLVQTGATSAIYQNSDKLKGKIIPVLSNLVQKLKLK